MDNKNYFNVDRKGEYVTAQPEEGRPWIVYSNSNDGKENYYRDAYSSRTGLLMYCYGESCKIEDYNEQNKIVTLSNDNLDNNNYPAKFEIPLEQFIADFV
ncbi:MAG: hypothetical protein ACOCRK_07445 [bacterium]